MAKLFKEKFYCGNSFHRSEMGFLTSTPHYSHKSVLTPKSELKPKCLINELKSVHVNKRRASIEEFETDNPSKRAKISNMDKDIWTNYSSIRYSTSREPSNSYFVKFDSNIFDDVYSSNNCDSSIGGNNADIYYNMDYILEASIVCLRCHQLQCNKISC